MRAAFYERTGPAREVLTIGDLERIAEAQELVEQGRAVGNVLIDVAGSTRGEVQ